MEEVQEVIKHVCKICSKNFSCGRSLGGHMRSHDHVKINVHHDDDDDDDDGDGDDDEFVVDAATTTMKKEQGCSEGFYGLRENPKKTWRVLNDSTIDEDSTFDVVLDKLCKECGKGFQSMKALFGHMKCHSDKERVSSNKKKNRSFEFDDEQEESNATVLPNRKRRSKRRLRTRYINSGNTSSSVVNFVANSVASCTVSDEEKEQEQEVAMSLIMLSRDVRPWCGINSIAEFSDNNNDDDNGDDDDNNSLELEAPLTHLVSKIEEKKRVISNGSEIVKATKKPKKLDFGKSLEIFADESEGNDGLKMKKTKKTRVSVIENGKDDKKKEKMEIEVDSDSAFEVNVRSKSGTTNTTKYTSLKEKFFDSETKVTLTSEGESSKRKYNKKGKFECATCNRSFQSYQALGGHRASHKRTKGCFASKIDQSSEVESIAELELEVEVEVDVKINVNAEERVLESERVLLEEEVPEIRNFLDLNLPATASIDEERGNGSSHSEIYKSWWLVGGSSLNQDAMAVGLLSN
ncbi:hypothetical protein TSUD_151750 [Trifolium subterraneum]|uniref:C2H2-type domain-containing protein n=1 Tax=Trifolium subterraneum TaxID=3900 RepID=A0A2Z6NPK6_TRISU|nr:hypothetical protein TSUD_151750 [Trifolium subterraneum]